MAGNSLEAFNLVLVGNSLINQGSGRIAGHLVEKDPAQALVKLRRYKSVRLWRNGDNLARFRQMFEEGKQNDRLG